MKFDGPPPHPIISPPYNLAVNGRLVAIDHNDPDTSPPLLDSLRPEQIRAIAILSEVEGQKCWGAKLRNRTLAFNIR